MGEGAMTGRYSNLTGGETPTLFLLIQTAILHPLKLLAACVQPEKWYFIAMTLLPLLGLPLLARRYERYLLLIPYILINLLPDYAYQHNIFFQYTFGSAAILIFLALRNLADLPGRRLRTVLLAGMALACSLSFFAVVFPKGAAYPAKAAEHSEEYQEIRRILEQIPEDAPVTASSFYTAPLSRRKVLYDLKYTSQAHMLETRYIVLDPSSRKDFQKYASGGKDNGLENLIRLLEEKGYALYAAAGERLLVYRLDWDEPACI